MDETKGQWVTDFVELLGLVWEPSLHAYLVTDKFRDNLEYTIPGIVTRDWHGNEFVTIAEFNKSLYRASNGEAGNE